MKKYYRYLISALLMGFADVAVDGVAHSISLDTIAAYAVYFTIRDVARSFSMLGQYTYRVTRKDDGSIIMLSMLLSAWIGGLVWLFRLPILDLFTLADGQREILLRLLNLLPFSIFSVTLVDTVFEIVILHDKLRLYNTVSVYFYIVVFIGYGLAYWNWDILYAIVGIAAADITSSAILLRVCGIHLGLPNRAVWHDIVQYGIPVGLERFMNRIGVFVSGVFASRMGNIEYVMFSVCNAVNASLEEVTNAYHRVLMVEVPLNKPFERQKQMAVTMARKVYVPALLIRCVLGMGYLLILHGSLELHKCFPLIVIYILPTLPLVLYETYKSLCLVSKSADVLLKGGILANTVRVLLSFICYRFSIAVWLFGLIVPAKFLVYALYEMHLLKLKNGGSNSELG